MKVLLQSSPQLGALLPQACDHQFERTVSGGLGESHMKVAVFGFACGEVVDAGGQSLDAAPERFGIVGARDGRGERRDLTLDQI